jgi:dTDP-4-dehydrorhamnose reductase
MENLIILGAKGTLGCQLTRLYPQALAWDREEADVTDFRALEQRIKALDPPPEAIINCVAFNDVDGAEEKKDAAVALNTVLPWNLAALTRELGIPLVTYSTNYVFDGVAGEYDEAALPSPLSIYARTKARGEAAVTQANPRHYIVRTAVIFGPKGASELSKKSFVDIMLDLSLKSSVIRAVEDEVNSITYAPDLAAGTRLLVEEQRPFGIYHISNQGGVSWFEFAREIFRIARREVTVLPVPSSAFPRKAKRPLKAVLLNTKLPAIRPWNEALRAFLATEVVSS